MRATPAIVIGLVLLGATPPAFAQKATEIYIPIGRSPGLSGTHTVIGRIETVNTRSRTMTVAGAKQTWTGTVSDETSIWLDRTEERQSNLYGTVADCRPGRLVEIKYEGKSRASGGRIEWIKVQVADSRTRAEAPPALAAATERPWFAGWLIPFP